MSTDRAYDAYKKVADDAATKPRFGGVVVAVLAGPSGNGFAVMALTQGAMRSAGATPEQIKEYLNDATSGDYDHLIAVTRKWVNLITA